MSTEPISRTRLGMRLVTNYVIAPVCLVAVVIFVCWLLVAMGIIGTKG